MNSCSGVSRQFRRASSASLPSPATSANLNPANVSYDRGFGIEFIHQSHNATNFNIASGTGKLGGALISQSLENSFFGNRAIEIDQVLYERYQAREQYRADKLNLALGGKLFRRKHFSLDAGILLKRHAEIKTINPGVGISARVGPLHIGGAIYQDDVYFKVKNYTDPSTGLPYATALGKDYYSETFTVQTYSVGTRISKLSLDAGLIRTHYDFYGGEDSTVVLYSGAYSFGAYLLNVAVRNETNPAMKIVDGSLQEQDTKSELFTSIQRSFGRHFIFGLNYNLYLLREISLAGTVFF